MILLFIKYIWSAIENFTRENISDTFIIMKLPYKSQVPSLVFKSYINIKSI